MVLQKVFLRAVSLGFVLLFQLSDQLRIGNLRLPPGFRIPAPIDFPQPIIERPPFIPSLPPPRPAPPRLPPIRLPPPKPVPTKILLPAKPIIKYDHNVIVPRVFRIGAREKVVLNLYKYESARVSAYVQELPLRENVFSQIPSRLLNGAAINEPIEMEFIVNDNNIRIFRTNQKVELVIEVMESGADFTERIEVDVTKESGYLFVQTDRPIYRPNERVEVRVIPLEQDMSPEKENQVEIIVKTPDGIGAFKTVQRLPLFGFAGTLFQIAENPIFGTWSVEATFLSKGYNTTNEVDFVVRRYVLPTFNVKIDMDKSFFFPTDIAISGYIRANYSFGEPVEGNYFLTMKLKKSPISEAVVFYKMPGAGSFLETAYFENGEYYFDVPTDEINTVLENGETLQTLAENSASISVEATVNARADGVLESDISPDLPLLNTPYTIDLSTSNKYYIPGVSFVFQAEIKDITTGQPADGIRIRVTVGNTSPRQLISNENGRVTATFDLTGTGTQVIEIATILENVADEHQARQTLMVLPYTSPSNSYLRITGLGEPARVGQNNYFLTFNYIPSAPAQIRYLILSRGTILDSGINTPNAGSSQSTHRISINQNMVPAFRVVAYYQVNDAEMVSASVWIDVVDQCKQELTIGLPEEVLPGAIIPFDIRGAPNAMVGIFGVDRAAYFLHQQERLTREEMFERMDGYDEGCVRNGGSNAKDVFLGAGLQAYGINLPHNADGTACEGPSAKRKKRNVEISQAALERGLEQCDRDGQRENLAGIDCEIRGRRCRENYEDLYPGCWRRFRIACYRGERERRIKASLNISNTASEADAEASVERRRSAFQDDDEPITATLLIPSESGQPDVMPVPSAPAIALPRPPPPPPPNANRPPPAPAGARPSFENSFKPSFQEIDKPLFKEPPNFPFQRPAPTSSTTTTTTSTPITGLRRSDFNEGLSWPASQIPSSGRLQLSRRARDSITTFVFDAVGMHDSPDGFCVAPPVEMRVFKDIFVQLNTPYALKKQEQADLRIVIFNYNRDSAQEVVVRVRTEEVYCTRFRPGTWSELVRMRIEAGGTGSASLSVFPLRIPIRGSGIIEVEIVTPGNVLLDAVEKDVLIEPEGEMKSIYESYPLDLKSVNADSFTINFQFPEEFVPGTRECSLFGYTNFLGPSIEVNPTTKEPRDIKSIFRMPYGCGEQNMLVTGPNVYAHMYLYAVGKLVRGTEQYDQSVMRIQDGFNRQLRYRSDRVNRRAWAVFTHYAPSTWLNAYVDRVFIRGSMFYTDMDLAPICNSLEWLLGEQEQDGNFRELRPPIHREMHGAVGGRLSLTAYVLITLVDANGVCTDELTQIILEARNRAVAFLEANKNDITFRRPYGLALLTYAISLHAPNSNFAREMNDRLLGLKQYTDNMRQVFWRGHPGNDISGTDVHPYWYNRRPQAIDVEATAYALLAQIELVRAKSRVEQSNLDLTRKIVMWLISQRNEGGAFISTQDTVVGLQGLATYQIWVDQVDPQPAVVNIDLTLTSPDMTSWSAPSNQYRFNLDNSNEGLKTEIVVPEDVVREGNIAVSATGAGEGVLSYRCTYRTVVDEDGCHFTVDHNVQIVNEGSDDGPPMTIKLTVTIAKPVGLQAEQSIIEISLITGFVPVESSLLNLAVADVVDGTVERYELTSQNVVLYMNRIDENPVSFAFLMEQSIKVDNIQPGKINIYDYYEPSVRCGIFYTLPGQAAHLRTANCDLANDELCQCAEGVCPICRTREEQLDNTTCLTSVGAHCEICEDDDYCVNMFEKACRSNFAYIVNITYSPDIVPTTVFAGFQADVLEVLKIGDDYVERNSQRMFMTRTDCYGLCRDPTLEDAVRSNEPGDSKFLREGFPILIMGTAPTQGLDRNGNIEMRYFLAKDAWLERVVPDRVCERTLRNINSGRLQCDDPNHPRSSSREDQCVRLRKFRDACRNMERLRALLLEGCG